MLFMPAFSRSSDLPGRLPFTSGCCRLGSVHYRVVSVDPLKNVKVQEKRKDRQ